MGSRRYENLYPHESHGLKDVLRWKLFRRSSEKSSEPFRIETAPSSMPADATGDRITWIGHSSFSLQLEGKVILVDPVFSDYCAPFHFNRFLRTAPPGLALPDVKCDAVLITHNH